MFTTGKALSLSGVSKKIFGSLVFSLTLNYSGLSVIASEFEGGNNGF